MIGVRLNEKKRKQGNLAEFIKIRKYSVISCWVFSSFHGQTLMFLSQSGLKFLAYMIFFGFLVFFPNFVTIRLN